MKRWIVRKSPLRLVGCILVVVGIFAVLVFQTVLVEGHQAGGVFVYDDQGHKVLDDTGYPIEQINPAYLDYESRQLRRCLMATAVVTIGVLLILADIYRGKRAARSV